jgi:hypothetical protein
VSSIFALTIDAYTLYIWDQDFPSWVTDKEHHMKYPQRLVCAAPILKELRRLGIPYVVEYTKKHVRIKWTFRGNKRLIHTARTPQDHRNIKNTLSNARRYLKQDGAYDQ